MRLQRPLRLLLLLAPSLAIAKQLVKRDGAIKEVLTNDEILELNRAPGSDAAVEVTGKDLVSPTASTLRSTQSSRPLRGGTEAAPVDGWDGKPHAGPFVDTTPYETEAGRADASQTGSAKAQPTSLQNFEDAGSIPEKNDGVMNDESRFVPKKETTGTEGGISEREKERKLKGETETKPKSPDEARPLPHDEQERVDKEKGKPVAGGAEKDSAKKTGGEYGAGGMGLEKPSDLPETPHGLPDPKSPTTPDGKKASEPPVGSGSNRWLHDTMPYTEGTKPKQSLPSDSSPVDEMEWHEWFHSFVLSFAMIIFSEIGDKTFLVAALMAMRHDRLLVFSAALSALIAMTVLSAVLGHAVPTLLPKRFTTFAAAVLFIVFGAKMLKEGLEMPRDSGVGEEMKEVEAELEEKEHDMARRASRRGSELSPFVLEAGKGKRSPSSSRSSSPSGARRPDRLGGLVNLMSLVLSPAWVQTFIMTFLGEWGDRSQIATVAMAAGQDYWWVTMGAIVGHACCTGLAVIGGRALAGKVSMRAVTIGGALAFLVFGVIYIYESIVEA